MQHTEPSVAPISAGGVLARLAEVVGAIHRHENIAAVLPDAPSQLANAQHRLNAALGQGEQGAKQGALTNAQTVLQRVYETVSQPGLFSTDEAPSVFRALNFPDPLEAKLQAIDVSTIVTTFSQPQRQVLMSLSFSDAPNAIAYWLRETRVVRGEDYHDYLLESYHPQFRNVRLAPGKHRFNIQSRDMNTTILSDEFEIEIPEREGK